MKKKFYITLIVSLILIFTFIGFISKNYNSEEKDKIYLRIVYLLPNNFKSFIKEKIFVYDQIRSLENKLVDNQKKINLLITNFENLQRSGKIEKIFFTKVSTQNLILDNKKFSLEKFQTDFLNTSKNIDANAKGTSYIDIYKEFLFLVSATGITSVTKTSDINEKNEIFFDTIKNNISEIIKYEDFFIDSKYGIKDAKIIDEKLYISYTNELKKNCFNISILVANINFKELVFEKFFEPEECVSKNINFTKFNPHHSGGRIDKYNDDLILLSTGDFKNLRLSQNDNSIFGKILLIDKVSKNFEIFSKGLRNPQGMFLDSFNSLIISTDHGPEGGDEINLQKINNNEISNFGWPISSYGEHYGFKSKDEKNTLYKLAPLYKSHSDHGFIEPVKYFTPGIGISQVEKFSSQPNEKKYLIGSMGHNTKEGRMSLHLIELDNSNTILKYEKKIIGGRIRDMVSEKNEQKFFLLIENGPILGYLKILE